MCHDFSDLQNGMPPTLKTTRKGNLFKSHEQSISLYLRKELHIHMAKKFADF